MKIRRIKATWLSVPIPEANRHRSDFGIADSFDTVLVEVERDDGLTGVGEAKSSVFSKSNNAALVALVAQDLGPQLIGSDSRGIAACWDRLYCGSRYNYSLTQGRSFPIMGRRGLTLAGISGIDVALWDLAAKRLKAPLHELLGGKRRDAMLAYASGGWADEAGIGKQLLSYVERGGFKAVKMRVGIADGDVRHSVARTRAAREALGESIGLMCDAHGTWSLAEAKAYCKAVEPLNLVWLEEPISPDNKPGLQALRSSTAVPIACGESETTRFGFRDLLQMQTVDFLQPDIALVGGVTEARRIEALCSSFEVSFAPHLWGGAPSFAAGLHLAAASNASRWLEYSLGANPMLHELAQEAFKTVDGEVTIPDRPGLGITIDRDFVAEYAVCTMEAS